MKIEGDGGESEEPVLTALLGMGSSKTSGLFLVQLSALNVLSTQVVGVELDSVLYMIAARRSG